MSAPDALDLVVCARDLMRVDAPALAGTWQRAAAVLARQSLETSLDRLWALRCPGLEETSHRCQLLCLSTFLRDEDLAERAGVVYEALSRAMHHHPYELAPTSEELSGWLTTVWDLANRVEGIAAGPVSTT